MFTRINKQGVKSSDGFEVQVVDRFTIEYREGGKTMSVYVDGDSHFITDDVFAKWDPPFKHVEIPAEKRQQIRLNFNAALKALDE
jgi:hypothetical protein